MIYVFTNNNGHFVEKHYFRYKNINEARKEQGLINENVPFKLVGFKPEQEKVIRENIFAYTTKSNYQTFYGFWFNLKDEDKEMMWLEIDSKNEESFKKLPSAQIFYKKQYYGEIIGSSINLYRKQKTITLDVLEYQNHKPIKLGEVIIEL